MFRHSRYPHKLIDRIPTKKNFLIYTRGKLYTAVYGYYTIKLYLCVCAVGGGGCKYDTI